jgi:sulfite reductase alpha subunit-like flavoprotein
MNGKDSLQSAANERRLTILYATQTGNAQDLAESLARHALRLHFTTQCLSMDEYTLVFIFNVRTDRRQILRKRRV